MAAAIAAPRVSHLVGRLHNIANREPHEEELYSELLRLLGREENSLESNDDFVVSLFPTGFIDIPTKLPPSVTGCPNFRCPLKRRHP